MYAVVGENLKKSPNACVQQARNAKGDVKSNAGHTCNITTAVVDVCGVQVCIELTPEQLEDIKTQMRKTGYERANFEGTYYYTKADASGVAVQSTTELGTTCDNIFYEIGNYYTKKSLAVWCSQYEKLQRKLRRYAAENNMNLEQANLVFVIEYDPFTKTFEAVPTNKDRTYATMHH